MFFIEKQVSPENNQATTHLVKHIVMVLGVWHAEGINLKVTRPQKIRRQAMNSELDSSFLECLSEQVGEALLPSKDNSIIENYQAIGQGLELMSGMV